MAFWIGMEVQRETTSRLYGYGVSFWISGSVCSMRSMSCMLSFRRAGTCLINALSVRANSHDRRVVGLFVLETIGLI